MKFIIMSLIFFACLAIVPAQPIDVPWKGQREIIEIKDAENKIESLSEKGVPCGKYFTYSETKDQKVLSFKIQLMEADKNVSPYQHIDLKILRIEHGSEIDIPSVEDLTYREEGEHLNYNFVIHIAEEDYKAADCLSNDSINQADLLLKGEV